jgi:hypothetical protein
MIVQYISGKDIKVPELKQIIGAGSGYITIPYNIAFKYRKFLRPIQMSDTLLQNKIANENVKPTIVDNEAIKVEAEKAQKEFKKILDEVEYIEDYLDEVAYLEEEAKFIAEEESVVEEKPKAPATKKRRGRPKGSTNKK